ncbi:MAG: acyltransferase [Shewanella vesiculosa]|uniref:acyltransferase n=1 Tax=Shewanella TaxID=22 RepID=UPI000C42654A|nr:MULTISPECIES: acyltransferase [Shewanella]PIX69841.1 MAG: acyltransferase [Shewanella sp. CG_4_10_14_3_um_filter_42_91]PIY63546.1 MAG: acyltransferase [Shewanella sp. CG_4_10_14_0_8_um_filter_42_13]PJB90637.1 MAG: acyltransferase [Shewanella sp. CG_4_9_14_0_8_um_filter_42_14]NCP35879.1 acyltransferase [Shewanella vesiculosa]NCQ00013.1 acyltransferase [Shewanella vesiculosa]
MYNILKVIRYVKFVFQSLKLYFWNHFFTNIPFSAIRMFIVRFYLKKIGCNSNFLIGVQLKEPGNIVIGNRVVVNSNVLLDGRGGLEIYDNVDIARGVTIWTMSHDYDNNHSLYSLKVIIKSNCWIGSGAQITPGVVLNDNIVVGCGSVVTKSFPENSVIAGVPAKFIKSRVNAIDYQLFYFPWFL